MQYYFAPLEGVTGSEFRRAHHRWFPGVDAYYMPFLSPTQDHVFTQRELRNVLPEHNQGFRAVPQLLTKNADDFLWCAGELAAMGYDEVNLNLGCPSGTVVAKGKGSGLLGAPEALDRMLDRIFSGSPVAVSLKTRLGLEDPEEFARLLEILGGIPSPCSSSTPGCGRAFTGTRCGWSILSRRWMPTMGRCASTAAW